jgi:hypothetical protein
MQTKSFSDDLITKLVLREGDSGAERCPQRGGHPSRETLSKFPGSTSFQAQLSPALLDVMPPCAKTALDALEKNSNAHGDCMRGQRALARSVSSPTLSGSRGQRSTTGHASVGTINAGLKWLEEHGVITSWIPKAGIYGVKCYRFANHLVRKNLARLKRLMLAQQARLRRSPLALLSRNLNRKKQKTFRYQESEDSWSLSVSFGSPVDVLERVGRGESEHPRIEAISPDRSPTPPARRLLQTLSRLRSHASRVGKWLLGRIRPGRSSERPAVTSAECWDEW